MDTNTHDLAVAFKARLADLDLGTLAERAHVPADPGYDDVRTPWNVAVDLRPAAVVRPHSAEEVVAVVRAARDLGLRVAPQSTGHAAAVLADADLSCTVLLKLDELTGVVIDAGRRTARVLGGTTWSEVIAAATPHGLTALHGSAGGVAVAGYLLGGGLSFYGRKHGLASTSIRSIEVVSAAGRVVHASASQNPELFWALRGGRGGLGVVVSMEIDLLPYATTYAGMLLWPAAEAPRVVPAWRDWTRAAPESATTSLRIMKFPPLPELPPFLSGREVVIVDGAVTGDAGGGAGDMARAEEVLAPLRTLAPELDTFGEIPAAHLLGIHLDPPGPAPTVSGHAVLGELPDKAIDALLATMATSGLFFAELRQLGGALARPAAGGGILDVIEGELALYALAMAPVPSAVAAGQAAADELVAALAPWATGAAVPTMVDGPARSYGEHNDRRLAAIRAQADPDGLFA